MRCSQGRRKRRQHESGACAVCSAVSMMQSNAASFVPIIKATVTVEENDKTTRHAIQDPDLLTRGQYEGGLSFAFLYYIFCEDNLFICDACDAGHVRGLLRSSDTGRLNGLSARMGNINFIACHTMLSCPNSRYIYGSVAY